MKAYLLILLCFFASAAARAQDVLYFKDGRTMEVYVKKIDGSLVYYSANPGSPQRYVSKSKLEKVVYERGRELVFRQKKSGKTALADAHNVLTLAPVNLLVFGPQGGIGIGLDYERFIGANHRISVRVPVYAGFTTTEDIAYEYRPFEEGTYVWTAPGVRYHWLNANRKIDLASGISVVAGSMNYTYNPNDGYGTPSTDRQYLLTAVTIDNDFTLYSARKIAFGVHTAFGPVFGDFGEDGKWMVQIGLKVGRKF